MTRHTPLVTTLETGPMNKGCSVRNLSVVYRLLEWLDEFARGPEDLQLVVLGSAHHEPGVVLVPVKVADAVGEATVHEQSVIVSVMLQLSSVQLTARVGRLRPLPRSAQSQSC